MHQRATDPAHKQWGPEWTLSKVKNRGVNVPTKKLMCIFKKSITLKVIPFPIIYNSKRKLKTFL